MYTFQLLVVVELTPCYKKRIILKHPECTTYYLRSNYEYNVLEPESAEIPEGFIIRPDSGPEETNGNKSQHCAKRIAPMVS